MHELTGPAGGPPRTNLINGLFWNFLSLSFLQQPRFSFEHVRDGVHVSDDGHRLIGEIEILPIPEVAAEVEDF